MRVLHSLSGHATFAPGSVVSIGNFDGVHRGHQALLGAVVARARVLGKLSVAVTFDPHPARVLNTAASAPQLLTPLPQKLDLLAALGLDATLVLPFEEGLRQWTAQQFAQRILHDELSTAEIHEGSSFRFGRGGEADMAGLAVLGGQLGFTVQPWDSIFLRREPVSSTRVRSALARGEVSVARALLGRPYSIDSYPAPGRGYGTRYAVPTVNLAPYGELLPGNGVYVTTLEVGSGPEATLFRGVTNIGNRPTFGPDSFAVESHLLNFRPLPLTGDTPLRLTFLLRLRAERRFDSPDKLLAQIGLDVSRAKRYFSLCDALDQSSAK